MIRNVKVGAATLAALGAVGLAAVGVSGKANATAGSQQAVAPAPAIQAKSSGSGQFTPSVLPKGYKLFAEDDESIPSEPSNAATPESTTQNIKTHVLEYSLYNAAERSQRADRGEDLGPQIAVVVANDPNAKVTDRPVIGDRTAATSLRGRVGELIRQGPTGPATAIQWVERDGVKIQVSGTGAPIDDVSLVAKGLTEK